MGFKQQQLPTQFFQKLNKVYREIKTDLLFEFIALGFYYDKSVVVYRSLKTDAVLVRDSSEFFDGEFELADYENLDNYVQQREPEPLALSNLGFSSNKNK